jgi:hypothetical protein
VVCTLIDIFFNASSTVLFLSSVGRSNLYPKAILSLCSLGIVTGDSQLAQNAAAELLKCPPESLGAQEMDAQWLLSKWFLLQGDAKLARAFLSKALHHSPWTARRWIHLSELLSR